MMLAKTWSSIHALGMTFGYLKGMALTSKEVSLKACSRQAHPPLHPPSVIITPSPTITPSPSITPTISHHHAFSLHEHHAPFMNRDPTSLCSPSHWLHQSSPPHILTLTLTLAASTSQALSASWPSTAGFNPLAVSQFSRECCLPPPSTSLGRQAGRQAG